MVKLNVNKILGRTFFFGIIVIFIVAITADNRFENALEVYYKEKDYKLSASLFKESIKDNESQKVKSYYYLGYMYAKGLGVESNIHRAIYLTKQAAKKDYIKAEVNLAYLYLKRAINNDWQEAIKWLQKASEAGDSRAQKSLGILYYNGKVIPKDYKKAFFWLQKSAYQKDNYAMMYLAYLYIDAKGVDRDYTKAKYWFDRSSSLNESKNALGVIYYKGLGVKQDYNKALKYFKESAKEKNADSLKYISIIYYYGYGVKKDRIKAYKYWSKYNVNR
jgi:TPR repeat protein